MFEPDSIEDYAELAVQFGYASLFVVSYPLTPLLAFVSNMIEIKVRMCEEWREDLSSKQLMHGSFV
jgi:hypothetical protein